MLQNRKTSAQRLSNATVYLWSILLLISLAGITRFAAAADFNVNLVSQFNPLPGNNSKRYADVWAEGNYAYIGSSTGAGVFIIDISVPSAPALVYHYDPKRSDGTGELFQDIQVKNGIGYFASHNGGGVHIMDLTDPTVPSLIAKITSANGGFDSVHNLLIDNGILYLADTATSVVKVFNVGTTKQSNKAPTPLVDIATCGTAVHDITVANNRLYSSDILGGVTDIYDITNISTTNPTHIGSFNSGSSTHSSWPTADGSFLVVAREIRFGLGAINIYDISSLGAPSSTCAPENLTPISTITADTLGISATSPHNPVVIGSTLYVSWYEAGLQIFDISNPFAPAHIGSFDTHPYGAFGFDYWGNWGVYPFRGLSQILLSDTHGGLFVVDASALCTGQNPITLVTSDGDGTGATNQQLKVRFIGNIVNANDFTTTPTTNTVRICPGTTVQYEAITTNQTTALCTLNGAATTSSGSLQISDKLVCTNKPRGQDTDRFRVIQ